MEREGKSTTTSTGAAAGRKSETQGTERSRVEAGGGHLSSQTQTRTHTPSVCLCVIQEKTTDKGDVTELLMRNSSRGRRSRGGKVAGHAAVGAVQGKDVGGGRWKKREIKDIEKDVKQQWVVLKGVRWRQ
ncbi:hypothetical protein L1887_29156 [Cichorium endivia]|nr:hypothetical protein L1887_29156 [Cichorium endivia]